LKASSISLPLFGLGTAHALYAQLVAPLELTLEGNPRVYVVADGARSATLDPVEAARLVALPGTRAELEQVCEALGAPREALFLGESMTESAIRSADLSTTRVLHLATHGFTSEESGEAAEPGLVFTPPADARPEDGGYLAASDVVGLGLTLAQWVDPLRRQHRFTIGQAGRDGAFRPRHKRSSMPVRSACW
jgi:hypothetical protein